MTTLAVLILTKNEELHIGECVKSARFADEVLVIDSGSSDRTIDIAKYSGAAVVIHPMDEGFAAQRNFALTQTEAEWVMYLDADERITPELAAEILQSIADGKKAAYKMPRRNIAFGRWLRHGGWYPDYCLRLYPRTAISWEGIVHEKACVDSPREYLHNALLHYTYYDWERYFNKLNSYTTLMARQMYAQGKRGHFGQIIFRPWWAFIRVYVLRSGWRDGRMGFIMAAFHFFYTMAKYVKLSFIKDHGEEHQ